MNSSRIELLWLVCDQSRSKYYLRTQVPGWNWYHKIAETYAITQRTSSKVTLILVLYDFIVQNILSSLLLLCYNLMIMNDYE